MHGCAQSLDPPNHQMSRSDEEAKRLLNYGLTWVLHLSDASDGVGGTLNSNGAGHIFGVEQGVCLEFW